MGDINMRATDNAAKEITGKDLPRGILPAKAVVKFEKKYEGRKRNAGSVVMMLAKGEDKSVQGVCFYTAPWQIGKKIVEALDEVAKVKGFEGNMKKRHPGLEWIGIDKGALTQDCDYVEKMGWVATPGSCHGPGPRRRKPRQHGQGPVGGAPHFAPAVRLLPRRDHRAGAREDQVPGHPRR